MKYSALRTEQLRKKRKKSIIWMVVLLIVQSFFGGMELYYATKDNSDDSKTFLALGVIFLCLFGIIYLIFRTLSISKEINSRK